MEVFLPGFEDLGKAMVSYGRKLFSFNTLV